MRSNDILKQASTLLRGRSTLAAAALSISWTMRAEAYATESICALLPEQGVHVAARTYREWKKRLSALRTVERGRITDALRSLKVPKVKGHPRPEITYGRRKMMQWLRLASSVGAGVLEGPPQGSGGLNVAGHRNGIIRVMGEPQMRSHHHQQRRHLNCWARFCGASVAA